MKLLAIMLEPRDVNGSVVVDVKIGTKLIFTYEAHTKYEEYAVADAEAHIADKLRTLFT